MPFICIGPVCIPWTCLPPIVFFLWKFIKPVLPKAAADVIEKYAKIVSDFCAPYIAKIPGMGKKKKKEAPAGPVSTSFESGAVVPITSEEHLDAMLAKSKSEGFGIVLDFTASWCKPCQKIKPRFAEMAKEHSKHCFMTVDADDLDDVMTRCGVMGLPTFQVYLGGEQVGTVTGGDESKVVALVTEHLKAGSKAD